MLLPEPVLSRNVFSKEAIQRQLHKIVSDPIFQNSAILRRFLLFIVGETLEERSDKLKEYTIARNVLNKPFEFMPRESGIVRIHATRLRRSLNYFYSENGLLDPIRISIPKGSYVPVFGSNEDDLPLRMEAVRKSIMVGVAPFNCTPKNESISCFSEGLGVQLRSALMNFEGFSVAASHTFKTMDTRALPLDPVVSAVGVQILITGDIQIMNKTLRIHLQMIRTRNSQIIWSQMYERKFITKDIFSMQDEIVKSIISELGSLAF